MIQSFRPDGKIQIFHWVCGNHPISLHLEEDFMTEEELINIANEEIVRGEVGKRIKVTTIEEAIEVIKESGVVYLDDSI